jgi:hypothetical protein
MFSSRHEKRQMVVRGLEKEISGLGVVDEILVILL